MRIVIFTDLDGTLLDYANYSFDQALKALELLEEKQIPLVICSSKTKTEIVYFREKLNNRHPFIAENGGGIFFPKQYTDCTALPEPGNLREEKDYWVIELGANYRDLRMAIRELQKEGFDVRGFGDMDAKEVVSLTGLSLDLSRMATERDFDEPFLFRGTEEQRRALFLSIKAKGFNFTEGRFFHLLGNSDKGKAVSMVSKVYKREYAGLKTVAIGDSPNDLPMLESVDFPIIVQKPDGSYDSRVQLPALLKADGVGPYGWNKAVLRLLETL